MKNLWNLLPFIVMITCAMFMGTFSDIHELFLEPYRSSGSDMANTVRYSIQNTACTSILQVLLTFNAFFSAFFVFRYLFTQNQNRTIHMLPLTRTSLFATNVCSGFVAMAAPIVFCGLFNGFYVLAKGFSFFYVLPWMGITLGFSLFFYSLAVFTVMLTGHIIALPVLYVFINFCYYIITTFLTLLAAPLIYGVNLSVSDYTNTVLSPFLQFHKVLYCSWEQTGYTDRCIMWTVIYSIAGVALLATALILYRKRPLETQGEPIIFKKIQSIFHFIGTFLGAGLLCIILKSIFFNTVDYCIYISRKQTYIIFALFLISAVISYYLLKMLLDKTVHVFRSRCISLILCLGLSIAVFAMLKLDITGIESRIPDVADISTIEINYDDMPIITEDEESFNQILNLHQNLIDSKQILTDCAQNSGINYALHTIDIYYKLKDGKTMCRTYYFAYEDDDSVPDSLLPLLDKTRHLFENSSLLTSTLDRLSEDTVLDSIDIYRNSSEEGIPYSFSGNSYNKFLDAVRKDIQSGHVRLNIIPDETDSGDDTYYINLNYEVPYSDNYSNNYYWINLAATGDDSQTIQFLDKIEPEE